MLGHFWLPEKGIPHMFFSRIWKIHAGQPHVFEDVSMWKSSSFEDFSSLASPHRTRKSLILQIYTLISILLSYTDKYVLILTWNSQLYKSFIRSRQICGSEESSDLLLMDLSHMIKRALSTYLCDKRISVSSYFNIHVSIFMREREVLREKSFAFLVPNQEIRDWKLFCQRKLVSFFHVESVSHNRTWTFKRGHGENLNNFSLNYSSLSPVSTGESIKS